MYMYYVYVHTGRLQLQGTQCLVFHFFVDWKSGLMRAVKGNTPAHTEMLQRGVLRELLDQKWEKYLKVNI